MDDRGWGPFHEVLDAETARADRERRSALRSARSWRPFVSWFVIGGIADAAALVAGYRFEFWSPWVLFLPFALTSVAWLIGVTVQPRSATQIAWGIVAGILCASAIGSRWADNNYDNGGKAAAVIMFSAVVACVLIGALAAIHRIRSWTGR